MKIIQVKLTITLDEAAVKSLAELLAPAIRAALGLPDTEFDQSRDAQLRALQNAILGGSKPPTNQGLLIDSKQAAKLLSVCERTRWNMHTAGRMPPLAIHPHLFRHTFAKQFLANNGNDLVSLAQVLGHEDLNTTSRYGRNSEQQLAAGVDRVTY